MCSTNKNKDKQPVWLNEKGEIECPGKSCPQECNENCPIFCNTIMAKLCEKQAWNVAAEWGQKAARLIPDDPATWYNLGIAYGNCNKHRKAYYCFKRVLKLRPESITAMNGFREAEDKWIEELGFEYTQEDAQEVMCIAIECAKEAYKKKFFPRPSLPNIPELMAYLDTTPYDLLEELLEYLANPKNTNKSLFTQLYLITTWSFYVGIEAVQLWHVNWDELRLWDLMDLIYHKMKNEQLEVFVLKTTYGDPSKEEIEKLKKRIQEVCWIVISKFHSPDIFETENPRRLSKLELIKVSQIAYILGCAYRLHELGMH